MSHQLVRSLVSGSAMVLLLAVCGCSKKPAQTPLNEAGNDEAPASVAEKPATDTTSSIEVAENIAQACGLASSETFFEYNSARLNKVADDMFARLATCFTTGPLASRTMTVVGHADPRGDDEYNLTLGGSRAGSVADALEQKGLPAAQVKTSSRGELDATGSDEASWSRDRKVALLLVE